MKTQKVDRWFISDLHLGHEKLYAGRGFSSVDAMDSTILSNIAASVKPDSVLYILGDVSVAKERKRECILKLKEIECRKVLIGGNHDPGDVSFLIQVFEKVYGAFEFQAQNWILTHMPVHPNQMRRYAANLHGHMHAATVEHHQYLNLSVEQTGYKPLSLDEVKMRLREQWLQTVTEPPGR